MDEQGTSENNTSISTKKSDDAFNESKKGFERSPILVMVKPGEHKPSYFKPVTIEDSAIENISKESEENTVRRRRKFQDDNKTPKDQESFGQSPFYDLLMKNLKQRLDNFDANKDFQPSDIFHVSDIFDNGRKFQDDNSTPKPQENPTKFYDRVLKNYGDHLDNSRNKTTNPGDIYGIEELLERRKKLFKDWGIEDTVIPTYYDRPYQIPDYKPYDFKLPVFDPPKVDLGTYSTPSHRLSKSGVWFISVVAFAIIMFVLKLIARPRTSRSERRRQREREQQAPVTAPAPRTDRPRNNTQRRRRRDQQDPPLAPQPNEPYGSLARLVSSDFSAESPEADLPPTYAECATINDEIVNVHIDRSKILIADEPPPPYSACLGLFPNTDTSENTHKSQSNNQLQSSFVIDQAQNNVIETSLTTEAGQNDTNTETSRFSSNGTVDTTITIVNENIPETRTNVPQ